MFDKSTMAQLSELKTAIIASKEYGQGAVVGSNGRFGFVKLDAKLGTESVHEKVTGSPK